MMDLLDLLDARPAALLFPISSGIPIAADRSESQRHKWDTAQFPFMRMEVGDSFDARPPEGEELIYTQNTVSGAASSWARKRHEQRPGEPIRKFTTRQQGGRFVRCWRVE